MQMFSKENFLHLIFQFCFHICAFTILTSVGAISTVIPILEDTGRYTGYMTLINTLRIARNLHNLCSIYVIRQCVMHDVLSKTARL